MISNTAHRGLKGNNRSERAISQSAPVVFRENVLAKFHEIATDEEKGVLNGFAFSEQFVIPAFSVRATARETLSPGRIIDCVSRYFHLRSAQLVGRGRKRMTTDARMLAMYFMRTRFEAMSLSGIGTYFSNRDHTTVLHAIRKTRWRIDADPEFRSSVDDLAKLLDESDEMALVDV